MSLKLLGKNTIIYAIGNVCWRASAFLLIPIYTHSLTVLEYGLLATLLITIQIMIIIMNMGMRNVLLRFMGEYQLIGRVGDLLGTSCFINLVSGLIVSMLSVTIITPLFKGILHVNNTNLYVAMVCCVALVQSLSLHIMTYYRACNEAFKFMVIGIVVAILLFLTNFVFLYVLKLGIKGALLAQIISYSSIFLFLCLNIFSKTGIGLSIQSLPKFFKFGCPYVFAMSSEFVIGAISIYFLSFYTGLETVAIYSLGHKLTSVLGIIVILPFIMAFQPYIYANLGKKDIKEKISKIFTYLILVATFVSFCILLGSRLLLPLIAPPEYSSAFLVILLLLPGISFIGPMYLGGALLGVSKKTHIIGVTMTLCAILSVIMNFFLIPIVGWVGAVITIDVSFIIAGTIILLFGIKSVPFQIEWRRICITFGLQAFILFVFFTARNTNLILFCIISLSTTLGAISILFCSRYFNYYERLVLKKLFLRCDK